MTRWAAAWICGAALIAATSFSCGGSGSPAASNADAGTPNHGCGSSQAYCTGCGDGGFCASACPKLSCPDALDAASGDADVDANVANGCPAAAPVLCYDCDGGASCSSGGCPGYSCGGPNPDAGADGEPGTADGEPGAADAEPGAADAGSSMKVCHTNADCSSPEVCYLGPNASLVCAGLVGQCLRLESPCNSTDMCTCLDNVGSCSGGSTGGMCMGGTAPTSCWICMVFE